MRIKSLISLGVAAVLAACSQNSEKIEASMPAKIEDGMIVLRTPEREPGQIPDFTRGAWDTLKGFSYAMK